MLISSCWQLLSVVELRPHGRFAHCSCKHAALAVRQPPVLASCIEIYYFVTDEEKLMSARFTSTFVGINVAHYLQTTLFTTKARNTYFAVPLRAKKYVFRACGVKIHLLCIHCCENATKLQFHTVSFYLEFLFSFWRPFSPCYSRSSWMNLYKSIDWYLDIFS